MIVTNWLIRQYVRFQWGYGYVSLAMAICSFGMAGVTLLTVKGMYIPLWLICGIAIAAIAFCGWLGYFCEKHDIQNRITSHANRNANPEFDQLCKRCERTETIVKELLEKMK